MSVSAGIGLYFLGCVISWDDDHEFIGKAVKAVGVGCAIAGALVWAIAKSTSSQDTVYVTSGSHIQITGERGQDAYFFGGGKGGDGGSICIRNGLNLIG